MVQSDQKRILNLYDKGIINRVEAEKLLSHLSSQTEALILFDGQSPTNPQASLLARWRQRLANRGRERQLLSTFSALESIDLACGEGSIKLQTDAVAQAMLHHRVEVCGPLTTSVDQFLSEHLQLTYVDGRLVYRATHPQLRAHLVLTLPKQIYRWLRIQQNQGDLTLTQLEIEEMSIRAGQAQVVMKDVTTQHLELEQDEGQTDIQICATSCHLINHRGKTIQFKSGSTQLQKLLVQTETAHIICHYPRTLGLVGRVISEQGKVYLNRTCLAPSSQVFHSNQAQCLNLALRTGKGNIDMKGV